MKKKITILLSAAVASMTAAAGSGLPEPDFVLPIEYTSEISSNGITEKEYTSEKGICYNITEAEIMVFLPETPKPENGYPCIVIFPGGGYANIHIRDAGIHGEKRTGMIADYFLAMSTRNMVLQMMAGVRKADIRGYGRKNLTDYLGDYYPFVVDPMPNLYFTRDPFACVGDGVSIHRMYAHTRDRETLFARYIFRHHPEYGRVPLLYEPEDEHTLEGGDILVLSPKVAAVGISQRTHPVAIELLAKRLLQEENGFEQVLAIDIPKARSFMHLDTVFTMVDRDKFTVHPNIREELRLFVLERGEHGRLSITEEHGRLEDVLREHLDLDRVTLIPCGGDSPIDAAREQWNDGSNTFAVAPGKVVVYDRNHTTNRLLADHGIQVLPIPSSELSRGRGGPRCMTMPLRRDPV